jgi:hypothetical protein
MAKCYMMEFTDKVTQKRFYKFGVTKHMDAMKRFTDPVHGKVYEDFDIKCVASIIGSDESVIFLESALLEMFPKNIWLEEYLGDQRTWDGFSGITEIVALNEEQYKKAVRVFYNVKERVKKWKARASSG